MNCREMQGVLPGLAEREGTPRLALEAARHLASCVSCAETLLRLRALGGLLDRLPKAEVPRSFARRVLRALPRKGVGAGVVVLAALACGGAVFSLDSPFAFLTGMLSAPFEAGLLALSVALRCVLALLEVIRGPLGEAPPLLPRFSGLSFPVLPHILPLVLFFGTSLAASGSAFARSALQRVQERR